MDNDPRNPLGQDFWSFCDAINAENCKTCCPLDDFCQWLWMHWMRKHEYQSRGHCYLSKVICCFSFDQFSSRYNLSLSESSSQDKHCYSQLLELLVNVWAYHNARRMVYDNPETGAMQEQHKFKSRRVHLWVKWSSYSTLKSTDEDFAEESDFEHPRGDGCGHQQRRSSIWQGIYEKRDIYGISGKRRRSKKVGIK
ncbi:hypothetical protein RchiOBHm_Chr1g0358371 [Rosa chinensis]|uniref:Uncharacterized protein n=1 Tax=Rosa chinensis TaxID=74649 RepID=A0A2P6SI52_ROSCH|nr:hypothetical protein RchiOBHm_Chr1g0358371 [Rosa chinensis]